MTGGDWIGLAALIVAIGGLLFTWFERGARKKEIALLERSVEGEEQDRQANRRADLVADQGRTDAGERQDTYCFAIKNLGPSTARKIRVRATGEAGEVTPQSAEVEAILAGEEAKVSFGIPQRPSREGGLTLRASWEDATGKREQDLCEIDRLSAPIAD